MKKKLELAFNVGMTSVFAFLFIFDLTYPDPNPTGFFNILPAWLFIPASGIWLIWFSYDMIKMFRGKRPESVWNAKEEVEKFRNKEVAG